ncbi:MAG TPA: glycosyltransferase family 2 protein, partial [Pseudobdellovibrionaceae bacterium]|nr:glycosyltransferase family 2 protein [Pseudobdellovibrionaceae bacterium]
MSLIPLFLLYRLRAYCWKYHLRAFSSKYHLRAFSSKYQSDHLGQNHQADLTSVIIPCKGTDFEFEKNLSHLTLLDPRRFEVIFVTATDDDPAREAILQTIEKLREKKMAAKLITAGIRQTCAQKLFNLVQGAKAVSSHAKFLVFIDADVRVEERMLLALIRPLSDDSVGATTGFPIFIPSSRISSIVRFAWGVGGMLMLADSKKVFTHGAINSMRRRDFIDYRVEEKYLNSVSDSLTLTSIIRTHGKQIVFVPEAVVPSHDDISPLDLLKWSNRLTILMKIYHPQFWIVMFMNYATLFILYVLMIVLSLQSGSPRDGAIVMSAFVVYPLLQVYIFQKIVEF